MTVMQHTGESEREQRLGAVLAACLEAMDDGRPPDRAELLGRHPEFAAELARFLDDQERVERCAAPLRAAVRAAPPGVVDGVVAWSPDQATAASGVLGDFRILRELGRGGMGVVYEAEQISLGRRVALKVLPFAGAMDTRHLQRFQNEARAAAGLHHTNIVPVFSVGCERGVSYYAMQFIDGCTLAHVIRELRRPSSPLSPERRGVGGEGASAVADMPTSAHVPAAALAAASTAPAARQSTLSAGPGRSREYYRRVAEWGVQAAEALDHAHQAGVVHRDVKPANLMLDGSGRVWVTDFGLAQMQNADAGLTMTGDLLGTLRYMSPEQALAKRVPIDHRTDVYSLGATLYELLTLCPAFGGRDRQELLRQIAFEEPRPPRRLERRIPAELEIIVLKGMEKNPADRYGTAQEMADDLRRWQMNQPIRARRPSWRQVAVKWAQRHRSLVGAVAAVLLLTVLLGGAAGVWWLQTRAAADGEARGLLGEAKRMEQDERWEEALNAVRHAQGLLAGFGADSGLRREAERLNKDLTMIVRLKDARLNASNSAQGVAWINFEAEDRAYGEAFADYGLDVTKLERAEAAARVRASAIHIHLLAALYDWSYVRTITRAHPEQPFLVARLADDDTWRKQLFHVKAGHVLALDPQEADAAASLERLAEDPRAQEQPVVVLGLLGQALRWVGAGDAEYRLLRDVQRRRPGDFYICSELASILGEDPATQGDAIGFARAALALRPQSPGAHLSLGYYLDQSGRQDEAIAEYQEAIRLKGDFPNPHYGLGCAFIQQGRFPEAVKELRRCLELTSQEPDDVMVNQLHEAEELVQADARLADVLQGKDRPKDAGEWTTFAFICSCRHQNVAAVRFYENAFADQPMFAEDPEAGYRYNAACAAALAGCGQGKDMDDLDENKRAALRRECLDWLRADLLAWRVRAGLNALWQLVDEDPNTAAAIAKTLRHWQQDADLAGVRGDAIEKLPAAERRDWRQLWADVAELLAQAKKQSAPVKPPGTK